jgi:hypothetical protein
MFGAHGEVDVSQDPGGTAILRDPVCDNGGKRVGHDDLRGSRADGTRKNGDQMRTNKDYFARGPR